MLWFNLLTSKGQKSRVGDNMKREARQSVRKSRQAERKGWLFPLSPAEKVMMSRPTVNIEGLVGGYTGPGGKTILPGKAVPKLDLPCDELALTS